MKENIDSFLMAFAITFIIVFIPLFLLFNNNEEKKKEENKKKKKILERNKQTEIEEKTIPTEVEEEEKQTKVEEKPNNQSLKDLKLEKEELFSELESKGMIDILITSEMFDYSYHAHVQIDDFTGKLSFMFTNIGDYTYDKIADYEDTLGFCPMYMGFRYENAKHCLAIATYKESLEINTGDKLLLLLEDKEIMQYEIKENGYRINSDEDGIVTESVIEISMYDLLKFTEKNIIKWRYIKTTQLRQNTWTIEKEISIKLKEMAIAYKAILDLFTKKTDTNNISIQLIEYVVINE